MANEEKFSISYSSLASYKACPCRFKNELKGGGCEASEMGGIFHEAMQKVLTGTSIDETRQWAAKELATSGMSTENIAEILRQYDRTVSSKYLMPEKDKIVAVESDDGEIMLHGSPGFEVPLPIVVEGKRICLRGRFDVVLNEEEGIEIIDWKTGFLDANDFQAECYALAAYLKYWKVSPIKIRFVYTRRKFSPKPLVFTSADMPAILEHIAILATSMVRDTEFKERLNPQCKNCSLRTGCSTYLEAISKVPAAPQIDPENWIAIQKWLSHLKNIEKAAKGFISDLTKLQNDYLKRHGQAVQEDGEIIEMGQQVQSYNYPVKKIEQLLSERGLDWHRAIKITTKGLTEVIESAVVEGKIAPDEAKEMWIKINGKKKGGDWEIEPIREIRGYKKVLKVIKQK